MEVDFFWVVVNEDGEDAQQVAPGDGDGQSELPFLYL